MKRPSVIDKRLVIAQMCDVFKNFDLKPADVIVHDEGDWFELCWEGGPYEWVHLFPGGGQDDEFFFSYKAADLPAHIYLEPATHYSLALRRH